MQFLASVCVCVVACNNRICRALFLRRWHCVCVRALMGSVGPVFFWFISSSLRIRVVHAREPFGVMYMDKQCARTTFQATKCARAPLVCVSRATSKTQRREIRARGVQAVMI